MRTFSIVMVTIILALIFISACHSSPSPASVVPDETAPGVEIGEDDTPCTVKVHTVKNVPGKCVRLRGGSMACQSESYLDPVNEDCLMFG
ncbi:hypothetical protein Ddc_00959 [Ditylenchus destructor]|nr:hypothetical protein Ddc_00959 [Ditylenchus destructor]